MARIVVVTPNPAVDVTYEVPRQVLGATVRVDRVLRRPGGKGVNVVRVLRTLGHEAVAVQALGGDTGRWLGGRLEAEGVRTRAVPAPEPTRTTVTVVDGTGDATVYAEPGPPLPDEVWSRLVAVVREECERGGTLVVAGSLPRGTDPALLRVLVEAAHRAGARAVVDSGGDALLAAADAGADLAKANEAEALDATGAPDLAAATTALLDRGARCVVVSRGPAGLLAVARGSGGTLRDGAGPGDGTRNRGSNVVDGRAVLRQPAVPGVRGNATGAGDAATAGIVAASSAGAPLAEALRWGAVVAAAAVLRPTAGDVLPADLAVLSARLPAPPPDAAAPPPDPHRTSDL